MYSKAITAAFSLLRQMIYIIFIHKHIIKGVHIFINFNVLFFIDNKTIWS